MTPTAKFRWLRLPGGWDWSQVLHKHPTAINDCAVGFRVLQQWWTNEYGADGEWRDIPIEEQA